MGHQLHSELKKESPLKIMIRLGQAAFIISIPPFIPLIIRFSKKRYKKKIELEERKPKEFS
ncbi:MAG: hypothetical protein ACM3H8_15765 [Sphingobacteriales bacterium]